MSTVWPFGYGKLRGIFLLAEELLSSQEGLCFMVSLVRLIRSFQTFT